MTHVRLTGPCDNPMIVGEKNILVQVDPLASCYLRGKRSEGPTEHGDEGHLEDT